MKKSRIVTFGLLILRICLLWLIYRYCLTNLKTNELMLAWGVFDEVLTQLSSGFWTPLPPFYLHVCFWATTFFPIRCVHKASLPTPSSPSSTHKLTRYHHLTLNAFKYLPIKSYQLSIQLKKNREQKKKYRFMSLIQCL